MITIFRIDKDIEEKGSGLYYKLINSLFISIRPSYFKEDCYDTDSVEGHTTFDLKKFCKILSLIYSDTNSEEFYKEIKEAVLGKDIKTFYYLDCVKGEETYSRAQIYVMHKVVKLCYSKFFSFSLFKKCANDCHMEILSNDASVTDKLNWLYDFSNEFPLVASSMTDENGYFPDITGIYSEIPTEEELTADIGIDFSDKDVTAEDFLKEKYRKLVEIEQKLENIKPPLTNEAFWDNLIISEAQKEGSMFDLNKYVAIYDSIHSIKDIINLFDSKMVMSLTEEHPLSVKHEETLWKAVIYDAIYYSYITVILSISLDTFSTQKSKVVWNQLSEMEQISMERSGVDICSISVAACSGS